MPTAVNQALLAKAIDHVDRDRLVRLTIDLTNIPSPTGHEGDVARALHEIFQGSGLHSTLQPIGDERYNTIGRLVGQGGGKSLMFNGHLDTSFGPEQAHRGRRAVMAGGTDEWKGPRCGDV